MAQGTQTDRQGGRRGGGRGYLMHAGLSICLGLAAPVEAAMANLMAAVGQGEVHWCEDRCEFPRWPRFVCQGVEPAMPIMEPGDPRPVDPWELPTMIRRTKDDHGDNVVVWWDHKVKFTDGVPRNSLWFQVKKAGSYEEAKRRAIQDYFKQVFNFIIPG